MIKCDLFALHEALLKQVDAEHMSEFRKYYQSFKKEGYLTNSEVLDLFIDCSSVSFKEGYEDSESDLLYIPRAAPPEGFSKLKCSKCGITTAVVKVTNEAGRRPMSENVAPTHSPSCPGST